MTRQPRATLTEDPTNRHGRPRRARPASTTAVALLLLTSPACAPTLASQLAGISAMAHTGTLPELREGELSAEPDASTQALSVRQLDAEAAVRIALLNNRALRAQLRQLGVAVGQLVTAGSVANPTLELELLPERDSSYEVRAEYDITSLIMAPLRHSAARDELSAARIRAAADVVELGAQVRVAFYALQAELQRIELAKQALETLSAAADAARALREAGNIPELDLASQLAAYERARAQVDNGELAVLQRREALHRLLGLQGVPATWSVRSALPLAPEIPPAAVDGDALERASLEANLDLRAATKSLDALAKQAGIARTQTWLPEIAVDVHALRVKSEPGGADAGLQWGAGMSLQLPLFDRGQGRALGLAAQLDAERERYQWLVSQVRSADRDARNQLVSAHSRARQYQTVIIPAHSALLKQTLLQYNAMQLGVFALLNARRELLAAELEQVSALRDYWVAQTELESLLHGRAVRSSELAAFSNVAPQTSAQAGH